MKTRKEAKTIQSTNVRIETELHKAVRIAAIEHGISMNKAINEAVEMWLKRKGVKKT